MKFGSWQCNLICTVSMVLFGATQAMGIEIGQLIRERVATALRSDSASNRRVSAYDLKYFGTPEMQIGIKVSERNRFETVCMFRSVDGYNNIYFKYGEACELANYARKEFRSRHQFNVELQRLPDDSRLKPRISEKDSKSANLTQLACVAQQAQAFDAVRKRPDLSDYFRKILNINKVNFRIYDESSLKTEDASELAEFRKSRSAWSGAEDAKVGIEAWRQSLDFKVTLKSASDCQYLNEEQLAARFRADRDDRMRKMAEVKAYQSRERLDHAAQFQNNLAAFNAAIDQLTSKGSRDSRQVDRSGQKARGPGNRIKIGEGGADDVVASPLS
jgi:hypothetical protein